MVSIPKSFLAITIREDILGDFSEADTYFADPCIWVDYTPAVQ